MEKLLSSTELPRRPAQPSDGGTALGLVTSKTSMCGFLLIRGCSQSKDTVGSAQKRAPQHSEVHPNCSQTSPGWSNWTGAAEQLLSEGWQE